MQTKLFIKLFTNDIHCKNVLKTEIIKKYNIFYSWATIAVQKTRRIIRPVFFYSYKYGHPETMWICFIRQLASSTIYTFVGRKNRTIETDTWPERAS